jgi:hypothetical protein
VAHATTLAGSVTLIGWVIIYLTAPRMLRGEVGADASDTDSRVEIPVVAAALVEHRQASQVGLAETQEYRLLEIRRWGEILGAETPIEAGDVLVFAASEGGIAALWRSPLFGMPPHRLYAVTIRAGETGTLHDLEQDGSIRCSSSPARSGSAPSWSRAASPTPSRAPSATSPAGTRRWSSCSPPRPPR